MRYTVHTVPTWFSTHVTVFLPDSNKNRVWAKSKGLRKCCLDFIIECQFTHGSDSFLDVWLQFICPSECLQSWISQAFGSLGVTQASMSYPFEFTWVEKSRYPGLLARKTEKKTSFLATRPPARCRSNNASDWTRDAREKPSNSTASLRMSCKYVCKVKLRII